MNRLLLWGAGGHGKVVLDVARSTRAFEIIAFIDDSADGEPATFCGCDVLGNPGLLKSLAGPGYSSFVASIGDNSTRAACFARALAGGLTPATLIDPSAVISPSAKIGPGTVVMPRAVVNAGAVLGQDCIVNTGAIVEHDCIIGDHVHLAPGSILGGGVEVHAFAVVGLGAAVLPGAEIGEGAVVGAGAVVLEKVPPGVTVAGVPARVLAQRVSR